MAPLSTGPLIVCRRLCVVWDGGRLQNRRVWNPPLCRVSSTGRRCAHLAFRSANAWTAYRDIEPCFELEVEFRALARCAPLLLEGKLDVHPIPCHPLPPRFPRSVASRKWDHRPGGGFTRPRCRANTALPHLIDPYGYSFLFLWRFGQRRQAQRRRGLMRVALL